MLDVGVVGIPDPHRRAGGGVRRAARGPVSRRRRAGAYRVERGLARYKCPEKVVVVETIPRNPMGKIQKDPLRVEALAAG